MAWRRQTPATLIILFLYLFCFHGTRIELAFLDLVQAISKLPRFPRPEDLEDWNSPQAPIFSATDSPPATGEVPKETREHKLASMRLPFMLERCYTHLICVC